MVELGDVCPVNAKECTVPCRPQDNPVGKGGNTPSEVAWDDDVLAHKDRSGIFQLPVNQGVYVEYDVSYKSWITGAVVEVVWDLPWPVEVVDPCQGDGRDVTFNLPVHAHGEEPGVVVGPAGQEG